LKKSVDGFRAINLRVHGIALWDDDLPQIDARDAFSAITGRHPADSSALVGT
jgi:hypothetical protein